MKIRHGKIIPETSTACVKDDMHVITKYNKKDYTIDLNIKEKYKDVYCDDTFKYIEDNPDWIIAEHLKDALEKRLSSIKALSMREFDTCARNDIDLNGIIGNALLSNGYGLAIIEGTAGLKDIFGCLDPWKLRADFNRGLYWKKNKRDKQSKEKQEKGDSVLCEIIEKLKTMGIKLWDNELNNGIHVELTKPEFMTWDQYNKKLQCKVTLDKNWDN